MRISKTYLTYLPSRLMEFVVNEWLPEYLKPTASIEDKRKIIRFIELFLMKENARLLVRRPSPFLTKLYRLEKDFPNDLLGIRPVKNFIRLVIQDSNKCRFIDSNEFKPLPESLVKLLSMGNYASDTYLFEAAYSLTSGYLIVTTDEKLVNHVGDKADCQLILLDEFLTTF